MAISKIILNGVTQMDVTQDTVTTSTLMSGETAHDASGAQITGTASGGIDMPTFTISESGGGTLTVTCDKTYEEAEELYFDSFYTALATFDEEEFYTASVYDYDDGLIYAIYDGGLPFADITYSDDGTITYTEPSGIPSGSTTHTATIVTQGYYDQRGALYNDVMYNNTSYYLAGSSFSFEAGQPLQIRLTSINSGPLVVMEDGEVISSTTGYFYSYYYTLPDHDIEIYLKREMNGNNSYVDISKINSNYKFIAATIYSVNTSSTTETDVDTFSTGDTSIWTSDKMVYVKIRDLNGRRNGYFYGVDAIFSNNVPGNSLPATGSYLMYGTTYYQNSAGYLINFNLQRTSTSSATTGYGVYPDMIYDDGSIRLKARYNSSYSLTINGSFLVEVYLLDWPGGMSPFNL